MQNIGVFGLIINTLLVATNNATEFWLNFWKDQTEKILTPGYHQQRCYSKSALSKKRELLEDIKRFPKSFFKIPLIRENAI